MGADERGVDGVPPVEPGELGAFEEPPRWPKVVGIISLVYAGLGVTCVGCGMAMPLLMPMILPANMDLPPSMTYGPLQWLLLGASLLLVGLLVVAGVMTVSRKPAGRVAHLVWAALSVPMSFAGLAMQLMQRQELIEWAKAHPDNPMAKGQDGPGGYIGMAVGLVIGLAWPTFCLIWFGLVKRDPKSMGGDDSMPAA